MGSRSCSDSKYARPPSTQSTVGWPMFWSGQGNQPSNVSRGHSWVHFLRSTWTQSSPEGSWRARHCRHWQPHIQKFVMADCPPPPQGWSGSEQHRPGHFSHLSRSRCSPDDRAACSGKWQLPRGVVECNVPSPQRHDVAAIRVHLLGK